MWKRATDQERKTNEFQSIAWNSPAIGNDDIVNSEERPEELEKKSHQFSKVLEVPKEERDRVQRMQVIDRAAAAIAATRGYDTQFSSDYLKVRGQRDEEKKEAR
ncbi:hypothetical protein NE237_029553 [Protea cynaroides]|uniref:Uncharacterized protein n=1 Tax=Protea cynaroides TaxID=273540 RepID=A0A9Q0GTD5_9MAGN|nr:hypothetical protein NE237_029553 [Protea cynaroides]